MAVNSNNGVRRADLEGRGTYLWMANFGCRGVCSISFIVGDFYLCFVEILHRFGGGVLGVSCTCIVYWGIAW